MRVDIRRPHAPGGTVPRRPRAAPFLDLLLSGGGVRSATNATSPLAFTTGWPTNCFSLPAHASYPFPEGAVCPMLATCARETGGVRCAATTVSLEVPPLPGPRNAIQPLPAAVGQPTKPGPANTPPRGAASPIAATLALEVAHARSPAGTSSAAPSRASVKDRRGESRCRSAILGKVRLVRTSNGGATARRGAEPGGLRPIAHQCTT